jgi:tetratricopeptide (TPR) repeat protein
LYNKGSALNNLGKYKEAIEYYDKALEIDPKFALTLYNKGNALYHLGKYNEAIECYDKALEIDPKNAYALNNRDISFNKLKDESEKRKIKWYTSDGKPVYE